MKKMAGVLMVLAIAGAAQASLLVYEPFNYNVANATTPNGFFGSGSEVLYGLTGQNSMGEIGLAGNNNTPPAANSIAGWDRAGNGQNREVGAGTLTYPGLPTSGNKAVMALAGTANSDRMMTTPISAGVGKTYYISALLNYGAIQAGFIQLNVANVVGGVFTPSGTVLDEAGNTINASTNWGLFCLGGSVAGWKMIAPDAGTGGLALNSVNGVPANTTVLLVAKLSYADDQHPGTLQLYANPDLSLSEAANAGTLVPTPDGLSTTVTRRAGSWNSLFIYNHGSQTTGMVDEIRVGTTWNDAVGVPEPATMSLLVLGGLGLLAKKRR